MITRQQMQNKLVQAESVMDQQWTDAEICWLALGVKLTDLLSTPDGFAERFAASDQMTRDGVFWMANLALTEVHVRSGRRFLEDTE